MTDLEQRLRTEFREEADRLLYQPPAEAPGGVRRRVRRAQVWALTAASVLTVTLTSAIFLVSRAVLEDNTTVRPAETPSPQPSDAIEERGRTVVAEGDDAGTSWRLFLWRKEDAWCMSIKTPEVDSGCHEQQLPIRPDTIRVGSADGIVYGTISRAVSRVRIETADGEVFEGRIYEPPPELDASFNLFVGAPGRAFHEGIEVSTFDSTGELLARFELPSVNVNQQPPYEPDTTDLGEGEAFGEPWIVWADRFETDEEGSTENVWCIGAEFGQRAAATCKSRFTSDLWADPAANEHGLIVGAISERVAHVIYEMSDGRQTEGKVLETPPHLGAPFDAFVLLFEGADPGGTIIAFDDAGREVHRLEWSPGPPSP